MGSFMQFLGSKRLLATLLGVSGAAALNRQLHRGRTDRAVPTMNRVDSMVAAREIVTSFKPREFICADDYFGLFANEHWQTIVGSGALMKVLQGHEPDRTFETVKHRVKTKDGDFFDVEFTEEFGSELIEVLEAPISTSSIEDNDTSAMERNDSEDKRRKEHENTPIVVVLHGLEATTRGALVTKMVEAYRDQGFACALVSFRGCSSQGEGVPPEPNLRPGAYHLGFTDDINQLTYYLQKQYPTRPIYLSGFSLGGNVCLKFLGEVRVI